MSRMSIHIETFKKLLFVILIFVCIGGFDSH
jgi:hypothetical protein